MNAKFSVLISVYDKENPIFFDQCLNSIFNNSYLPSEIVIIEDGPLNDDLEAVIQKFINKNTINIVVHKIPKSKCLGEALRIGVINCKYDFIARMDSDDICSENRFDEELKCIINYNYDIVGSNTIEFIDNIDNVVCRRIMPENNKDILRFAKERCPFVHPSVMYRKQAVLGAGNYTGNYFCEDYDLWVRMLMNNSKCYNIQKNLVYMRVSYEFYDRRGGIKYCKSVIKFLNHIHRVKFLNNRQFFKTLIPRIIISLAPSAIRRWFYKNKLREH